jgi:hypothetical protein
MVSRRPHDAEARHPGAATTSGAATNAVTATAAAAGSAGPGPCCAAGRQHLIKARQDAGR